MRKDFKLSNSLKKQRMLTEIAKNSTTMEGIVSINAVKRSKNLSAQNEQDIIQEYVEHFSHIADITGTENKGMKQLFANYLQQKVTDHLTALIRQP